MTQRLNLAEIDTTGGSAGQVPTIATDGKHLTYTTPTSGSSSGGTVGFIQLRKSANQSLPLATWTAVTWDVEDYDTYNAHSTTTNPSRITVPTGGIWLFHFHVGISSGATRYLSIYKNGVQQLGWASSINDTSSAMNLTHELVLTAGDYIEAFVYTNSTTSSSILATMSSQISGSIATARLVGTVA